MREMPGPTAMSTRTVGIVTINDDSNYGNRLQNFALQKVVQSLGWEAETLRNGSPRWDRALLPSRIAHEVRHDIAGLSGRVRGRIGAGHPDPTARAPRFLELRRTAIREFARDQIVQSPYRFAEMPAEYWSSRYTSGISGSDQVWNPTYRRAQSIDFLQFLGEGRRIAYAPSFGPQQVPGFLRSRYRRWLKDIPHLSARESFGRRIIAELTGREVPVVADPTLLAEKALWDRMIGTRRLPADTPYAVQFFIGRPTPEQDEWVRRNVAESGLMLVDLHDLDHEEFAGIDPIGFVAVLANADLVITDSFHAGVFSLLYRRPLVLRARFNDDPRWEELLSQHALSTHETGVLGLRRLRDVDWTEVEARREQVRAASLAFLRNALESAGVAD